MEGSGWERMCPEVPFAWFSLGEGVPGGEADTGGEIPSRSDSRVGVCPGPGWGYITSSHVTIRLIWGLSTPYQDSPS